MKIMIYAQHFGPSASGMPLSNLEMAKGLQNNGHEIEVIACKGSNNKRNLSKNEFKVHYLPKWPFTTISSIYGNGLLNWFFVPLYYNLVKKKINKFKPEVILVADETSNCFWGSWAKKIDVPYVSYCSVPYVYKWKQLLDSKNIKMIRRGLIYQLLDKLLRSYKYAKSILTVSSSTKMELIKGAVELKRKIHILPRSINNNFFSLATKQSEIEQLKRNLRIHKDTFVLVSVSRLTKKKGIDDVLKAIALLENSIRNRIKYIIIGHGPDEFYLKNIERKLKLDKCVIFLGKIQHSKLISYYDLCDVFILPSRRGKSESFGRVYVEAAARSKPSIATKEGGIPDIVQDGVTGFLVDAGDVEALKERIKILASNVEKVKLMGSRAREEAQKKYTRTVIAAQLQMYLEKAVSNV